MKKTIELDDTLPDRVQSAIDDVRDELLTFCNENEPDTLPDLGNDLDYSGAIHQIVDGAVPICAHEIKTAWFLHGSEIEEACDDAGVGENPMENNGMSAIYFYIDAQVREWYDSEAETVFDEWKAEHEKKLNDKAIEQREADGAEGTK